MKSPNDRLTALVVAATALHAAVAATTGLGDAEALYAVYARHLQGGYLDHPPAIGWLVSASVAFFGATPFAVRLPSVLLFVASILLTAAVARRLGGGDRAALFAAAVYAFVPELWVSGVAASPDAPLAASWLLALYAVLRSETAPSDRAAFGWALVAGAGLGAALLSKYSGALLALGLALWGLRSGRGVRAAVALALGAAFFIPTLVWNADHDWVSALHRLVYTQSGAGFSLRNVGALVGGQLAYVSPLALVGFAWAALRGLRAGAPQAATFLVHTSLLALVPAYALCLVSRVAEPHWPAPAYLGLVPLLGVLLGRATTPRVRTLFRVGLGWSAVVLVVLHLSVWTPLVVWATPRASYDGNLDLTNDLYGWPQVAAAVARIAPPHLPIVAPFYTSASQLSFALADADADADRVFCLSDTLDDFDLWGRGSLPGGTLAVVLDDPRFPTPALPTLRSVEVPVTRGGRVVRRFTVRLARLSSSPP